MHPVTLVVLFRLWMRLWQQLLVLLQVLSDFVVVVFAFEVLLILIVVIKIEVLGGLPFFVFHEVRLLG